MTPPRAPSHVDRSEQPVAARLEALEQKTDKHERDIAEMMNGEQRRDDRLKQDTLTTISSASTMMQVQGAKLTEHGKQLEEHGEILKELRDNSRASAEERVSRKAKENRYARRDRNALIIGVGTLVVAALGSMAAMAGHAISTPPAVPAPTHEK